MGGKKGSKKQQSSEEEDRKFNQRFNKKFANLKGEESISGSEKSSEEEQQDQAQIAEIIERDRQEKLKRKKEKKEKLKKDKYDQVVEEQLKKKERKKDSDSDSEDSKKNEKSGIYDHVYILLFLFLFICFMGFMKYQQSIYNKTNKISADGYGDLYQILEVDSNASQSDIRKAFKRLAAKWHPDKNVGCEECEQKFRSIVKANEVLGKENSRLEYDQTRGVTNSIKSRAIQLTKRNFEQFVLESNDVWIIQVYENNNRFSEQIGPFWESSVEKFGHLIKFGRINRELDYDLLKYLPYNIKIVPTIFSFMNDGSASNLYTFDRMNPEQGMHRFVADCITNYVKIFDQKESAGLYEKLQQYDPNNSQIDIVYLATVGKLPLEYKYAAFKYHQHINFYVSKYGQLQTSQKSFKTKDNLLIFYDNYATGKREFVSFKFASRKFDNNIFRKFLKLAKFMSIPTVDRSSFKDFCEVPTIRNENTDNVSEDSDEGSNISDQSLCFVINPGQEKGLSEVRRLRKEIMDEAVKEFKASKGDRLFENYSQIQFVYMDHKTHWKWEQALQSNKENVAPLDTSFAYAIQAENRKISFSQNIVGLEDWVLDLVDNEGDAFQYLNDYMADEYKMHEISEFLNFNSDTIPNLAIKGLNKYKFDWRIILTVLVTYFTLEYMDRNRANKSYIWKLCLVVYALIVIVFIYGDLFEEIHH